MRGQIIVFWPDVADRSAALVERHLAAEAARRERANRAERFYAALESRRVTKRAAAIKVGTGMGIHPNWVRAFLDELEATQVST